MTAIKSLHSRVFEDKVRDARMQILESLCGGHDEKTYLRLCGQIQGLDLAVKISEDADFYLSGDEPDDGARRA